MDKVRAFLKVLWIQRFWVLSGLGVIVAAVCWMLGSGALDAAFAANKQTIEGKFSDMDKIASAPVHGNRDVNDREIQEAQVVSLRVKELWQQLYDRQRETVLKWPDALGESFHNYIEGKKFRDPIASPAMLDRYRDYIDNRFDGLVEIVKAKKMAEADFSFSGGRGGDFGGRRGAYDGGRGGYDVGGVQYDENGLPIEEDYLVEWHDQGKLRMNLEFSQRPTSLKVWVTQEDLWVYETLLNVINATNEARQATRPDNAAIRWIVQLEVGRDAAVASRQRGNVMLPSAPAGGEAIDPAMSSMDSSRGRGGDGTDMSAMGSDPDAGLLAYRYIGEDGAPIADETGGFGVEYRCLPVRMVLYMDQRWLPTVLTECANAPLPIEVQRIRINADQSGGEFGSTLVGAVSADGGGDFGGRGGYDGGRGGYEGGRGGSYDGGRGGATAVAPADASPDMATVEIQGVVYIYNPPDASVLNVPGGNETLAEAPGVGEPVTR